MIDGTHEGARYARGLYPQVVGAQYLPKETLEWLATTGFKLLKLANVAHIETREKFEQSFVMEWQFQQGCEEGARRRAAELVTVGREKEQK